MNIFFQKKAIFEERTSERKEKEKKQQEKKQKRKNPDSFLFSDFWYEIV
jgi:hypothetical protein